MFEKQSIENTRRIDEYCDLFETNYGSDAHVPLGEAIQSWPAESRGELLTALLPLELELRARQNDWPDAKEYRAEFQSFEQEVTTAFREFQDWAAAAGHSPTKQGADTADQALDTLRIEEPQERRRLLNSRSKVPARIGRYAIGRELGVGGMGRVLLAQDEVLNRQVAIKLPHFDFDQDSRAIERFFREAQSMASLRHPNICPVYDVGEADGYHFLTMAYIEGQTLAEQEENSAGLASAEIAGLMLKLARAIEYSHESGVLHRDLKPSNVLVDHSGEPYVTDFGLALCEREEETDLTQTGAIIGSPAYMAPEQVVGERERVGPASDVYALGVILYELLAGQRPFQGNSLEILGQITSGKAPEPPSAYRTVAGELEQICLKAMKHRIEDRYASATDLAKELESYLGKLPQGSIRTRPIEEEKISATSSRLVVGVAGAAAMLVLALGMSYLLPDKAGGISEPPPNLSDKPKERSGQTVNASEQLAEKSGSFPVPPKYRLADRYVLEGSPLYKGALGTSVDIDGNIAVLGAPDGFTNQLATGIVFLLEKEQSGDSVSWRQSQILKPVGDQAHRESFGSSVAISGNRIAVTARNRDHNSKGSLYVFGRTDSSVWGLEQKIEAPADSLTFATDVAISENFAAVVSAQSDGREFVYLFERDEAGVWSLIQTLDPGPETKGFFDLDLDGSELVVSRTTPVSAGARDANIDLLIYRFEGKRWKHADTLIAASEYFGKHCLDLHGNQMVVGLSNSLGGCGSVQCYRKDQQGDWRLEQTLVSEQPVVGSNFGRRVAIGEERLLVSTEFYIPPGDVPTRDSVAAFQRGPDGWKLEKTWVQQDQSGNRLVALGMAVGDSGDCLIGAPASDGKAGQLHAMDSRGESKQVVVTLPEEPICPFNTLFASGLAVAGNEIAVGAKFYQHNCLGSAGQVQVLSFDGDERIKLFDRQPKQDAFFGELVLMNEQNLVIGSHERLQLFDKVEGQWSAGQILSLEGDSEHHFGYSGQMSEEWLAVSVSPRHRGNSDPLAGTEFQYVDLYRKTKGRWEYAQRLQAQDAVPIDGFGNSIAIQGEWIVVGARHSRSFGKGSGAAYVFRLVGNRWQQQQKLTASNGAMDAGFGAQVDLDGNMLAISADQESTFHKHSGAVYLFRLEGEQWMQMPEIVYPMASYNGSYFGFSIDLSGNRLLVGAREEGKYESGVAFLFYFDGQRWVEHQKFLPPGLLHKQYFGSKVFFLEESLVVAAGGENDKAGAVYVLEAEREPEKNADVAADTK